MTDVESAAYRFFDHQVIRRRRRCAAGTAWTDDSDEYPVRGRVLALPTSFGNTDLGVRVAI